MLFRGQFTITLDRARCGTAYKYLVINKEEIYYEELPEFPPKYGYSSIVNRSLKIPEDRIEPGGKLIIIMIHYDLSKRTSVLASDITGR